MSNETQVKTVSDPRITLKTRDESGRETDTAVGLEGLPSAAKLYISTGVVGTIIIAFIGILWTNTNALWEQSERRDREAATERKDMVDRYIAGREVSERRHMETLSRLDKIAMYIEAVTRWQSKAFGAGGIEAAPPPKLEKP